MTVRPTRRGLVTAAAGLAVGVGGTVGVEAAAGSGDQARRPPSPGEELMTEHGVLKRLLLAYRAAADQLAAGRTPPAGAVLDAAQIVSDHIESFHEGLEEAYVFPRVAGRYPDLVRTLLVQHDRGRHLTAAILTAAGGRLDTAPARAALHGYLSDFVRMYEPHEAWEDTVVYPALRALTPQRTLDELAERFADLESDRYSSDALSAVLARVAGVEQQLGTDDLAAVTPPPLAGTT